MGGLQEGEQVGSKDNDLPVGETQTLDDIITEAMILQTKEAICDPDYEEKCRLFVQHKLPILVIEARHSGVISKLFEHETEWFEKQRKKTDRMRKIMLILLLIAFLANLATAVMNLIRMGYWS